VTRCFANPAGKRGGVLKTHRRESVENSLTQEQRRGCEAQTNAIRIDPKDNVAVAIRGIRTGEAVTGVPGTGLTAREDILRNHKVSLHEIPENSPVIKYGEPIGLASRSIQAGEWVHTHNLKPAED
jgi:hypothetical protein